jgi:hypothetical protein
MIGLALSDCLYGCVTGSDSQGKLANDLSIKSNQPTSSQQTSLSRSSTMHFYIYNECYKTISATTECVPIGETRSKVNTQQIKPGEQKLLCTINGTSVSTESVSEDNSLHWKKETITLTQNEYTHVISCECEKDSVNCQPPEHWPYQTTRQIPVEKNEPKK